MIARSKSLRRFFCLLIPDGALVVLAGLALTRPLAASWWVFEIPLHFTPYWAVASLALGGIFLIQNKFRRGTGALLLGLVFGIGLVPYIPHSNGENRPGTTFRLVLFNVRHSNRSYADVRHFLERQEADLFVLQEFTREWEKQLGEFVRHYPFRQREVEGSNSEILVLSQFPIVSTQFHAVPGAQKPVLEIAFDVRGEPLHLVTLHPLPPKNGTWARMRNASLATAGSINQPPGARLLVGDLNCSPWSPSFRSLLQAGRFRDSSLGRGVHPTWFRRGLGAPIDHVLVSGDLTVLSRNVGPDLGSDHRPVVIGLGWGEEAHVPEP